MTISSFIELRKKVQTSPGHVVSVAGTEGTSVLEAVKAGLKDRLIVSAYLVGDSERIKGALTAEAEVNAEILQADTPAECAQRAVENVRNGTASILMKGSVDSASYLKAVVHREAGLGKNSALSNVTVAEIDIPAGCWPRKTTGSLLPRHWSRNARSFSTTHLCFSGVDTQTLRLQQSVRPKRFLRLCPQLKMQLPWLKRAMMVISIYSKSTTPWAMTSPFPLRLHKIKGWITCRRQVVPISCSFSTSMQQTQLLSPRSFMLEPEPDLSLQMPTAPVLLNSLPDSVQRRLDALLLAVAVIAGKKEDK